MELDVIYLLDMSNRMPQHWVVNQNASHSLVRGLRVAVTLALLRAVLAGGAGPDSVKVIDRVLEPAQVPAHFAAGGEAAAVASEPAFAKPLDRLTLTNACGLAWELQRFPAGWALGSVKINGKPTAKPLTKGVLMLRSRATGAEQWLAP